MPASAGEDLSEGRAHRFWTVAALLLMLWALAVRAPGLWHPPLGFHPVRQYRSAILARALSAPADAGPFARAAHEAARFEGKLEPPIIEAMAAAVYRLTGRESFLIGRGLSVLFWMAGGLVVLTLARGQTGAVGGTVALAVYVFTPFAVVASRSFQPAPFTVALILGSLWCAWRFWERRSWRWLAAAAVLGAVACLEKPMSGFFLAAPFVAWSTEDGLSGLRRRLRPLTAFGLGSFLPAAVYYVWGYSEGGLLKGQAQGSVVPGLLASARFWNGWARQIGDVVGLALLLCGLVGALLAAAGRWRRLLVSLAAAYVLMGLVFTYKIHTHSYYSLPLVPIVALAVAPLAEVAARVVSERLGRHDGRAVAAGLVVLGVTLASGLALHRISGTPGGAMVRQARRIGGLANHSVRTIQLAPFLGLPLEYHGGLAGKWWPPVAEQEAEKLVSGRRVSVRERLSRLRELVGAEYFIVTDSREFIEQRELRELLFRRYPVLAAGVDFIIFDLRRPRDGS